MTRTFSKGASLLTLAPHVKLWDSGSISKATNTTIHVAAKTAEPQAAHQVEVGGTHPGR